MSGNPVLALLQQQHTGLVSVLDDVFNYIAVNCSEVLPNSEKKLIFGVRPHFTTTVTLTSGDQAWRSLEPSVGVFPLNVPFRAYQVPRLPTCPQKQILTIIFGTQNLKDVVALHHELAEVVAENLDSSFATLGSQLVDFLFFSVR